MKHLVTGISIFFMLIGTAQETKLKKANQSYDDFAYIDAAKVYVQVAESGYKSEELFKKLGNTYYFKANYTDAEKWYQELYKLNNDIGTEYLLRFSQSLKAVGKEKKAEEIYDKFLNKTGVMNEGLSSSSDYLNIIAKNSNRYHIKALPINSDDTDYGAFVQDGVLYFSSTRNLKGRRGVDVWSNEAFLDIYSADYNKEEETYGSPVALKGDVNTKLHESSPVLTKDGKTMYFTRTNATPRIKSDKKEKVQLKIYRATKVGKKWKNIEDLSINGDNYSNVHPVLGPNGKRLYFSSNMPSSLGQTDLFYATINSDGTLGKPKNLGPKINTKGRESFPYITEDNELYFSSDGHFGLGGYDVFYIDLKTTGMQLLNVGMPINGPTDDFAFSIDNTTKKGFFSTNREEVDNIYGFTETRPIYEILEAQLTGVVTDSDTGKAIKNVDIEINSIDKNNGYRLTTDENGGYATTINRFMPYTITVSKKDYDTTDGFIDKGQNEYRKDFQLMRNVLAVNTSDRVDLSGILNIEQIQFDFNSSYLRNKSKVELEKISVVMKQRPKLKIEIFAHADSRGGDNYNIWLSERRARRARQYLIKSKIDPSRIIFKGYGESRLLNNCGDNVDCTVEEHQQNRRIEFIIVRD